MNDVGRPGSAPGGAVSFFDSPKKETKERRPHWLRPLRCAQGQPVSVRCRGGPQELASRLQRSAQTTSASQFTKRVHAALHAPPRQRPAPGASRGEWNSHTGHRCARPPTPQRVAPRKPRPSEAMARLVFHPCGRAEKRRAGGGRGHRRMPALRALTRCSCLSGAAQQQSEFCSATARSSIAGCPAAQRRGHGQWGRLLLPSFLGESRKEGAPPGACPGLPSSTNRHRSNPQTHRPKPIRKRLQP